MFLRSDCIKVRATLQLGDFCRAPAGPGPRAQGGGVDGPVYGGGLVVLIHGLVPVVSLYENADKGDDDDEQRYSHYGYHPWK